MILMRFNTNKCVNGGIGRRKSLKTSQVLLMQVRILLNALFLNSIKSILYF